MSEHRIELTVNGRAHTGTVEGRTSLADMLRDDAGYTGVHLGCEHGVCGACTVLVDGMPATSCSMLACDVDGREVTTIEGLARAGELDPVQQAFVEHGAMQCGFCTPGMVLAVKSLLAENPAPSEDEVRHYLRGNLCRCTGYVKIIEAVMTLANTRR